MLHVFVVLLFWLVVYIGLIFSYANCLELCYLFKLMFYIWLGFCRFGSPRGAFLSKGASRSLTIIALAMEDGGSESGQRWVSLISGGAVQL